MSRTRDDMRRSGLLVALVVLSLVGMPATGSSGGEKTMVITVLQSEVSPDRVADLEAAYRERTADLPAEIVETFLVRDTRDTPQFRIITVWRSREDLDAMRASGVTPTGVLIFQAAGAAPMLSIHDVVVHRRR